MFRRVEPTGINFDHKEFIKFQLRTLFPSVIGADLDFRKMLIKTADTHLFNETHVKKTA